MATLAARALATTSRPSTLRTSGSPPSPAEVFAAAADGDELAGEVVAIMADHVTMAIIALSSVTDPEVVVLDGAVGRALGGVRDTIQALVDRHLATPPRVVVSTLREGATVLGAVAAALDLSRSARQLGDASTGRPVAGPQMRRVLIGAQGVQPDGLRAPDRGSGR